MFYLQTSAETIKHILALIKKTCYQPNVVMDTTPEMEVYLNNTFPNAMEKLKQICEQ